MTPPPVAGPVVIAPVASGHLLVNTVDALVSGVHFPAATGIADVAWKSIAVNLSDLAAMGAEPLALQAVCEAADDDVAWREDLRAALMSAAVALDTRIAPATAPGPARRVVVQALGQVPTGLAITRAGARAGDLLWVSGTLGDAGAGLALALGRLAGASARDRAYLLARLNRPQPRTGLGRRLRGIASSAIDVSDGVAGDAAHLARRSGAGIVIRLHALPLSPELARVAGNEAPVLAVGAGDDYELLFSAPRARSDDVRAAARACAIAVTAVGEVVAGSGVTVLDRAGAALPATTAYEHFATRT